MDVGDEESLRIGHAGPSETQGRGSAAGLALSVFLHGVALLLLFLVGVFGTRRSEGGLEIVPVEVEIVHRGAAAPSPPQMAAALPQPDAPQLADPTSAETARLSQPATDALKAKLESLAKLRQPDAVTPNVQNGAATPDRVAAKDDVASGLDGPFSVKDYIRAQVERRWNFNLSSLGSNDFAVPIHVVITSAGVVTKAEIVDSSRASDPAYREVAVSARNAVLLSSPLALPAGHFQDVMDMVLYLNPRDALR